MATKKAVKKSLKKAASKKSTSKKASSTRKYSPSAGKDVEREMKAMKQGKLKSGRSGKTVTNPKQAIAIGLSEARKEGKKGPSAAEERIGMTEVERYRAMLEVALEEARIGRSEGGIPIGAALFDGEGKLLASGRNRRVQQNDPSVHGETDAFRRAGRQRSYRDKIMVTTLAPCWYCSGLVRQFGIRTLVVGESKTFSGGIEWLKELGVKVIDLDSTECAALLGGFIAEHPEIWNEDIGED